MEGDDICHFPYGRIICGFWVVGSFSKARRASDCDRFSLRRHYFLHKSACFSLVKIKGRQSNLTARTNDYQSLKLDQIWESRTSIKMPLSICDSSQKKRQAVQEEREKKRRRRSLPLTIESTTSVNPEKVHKRRLSRRLSKSDLLNNVSAQKADGPEQPVRRNSMSMANKENGQNNMNAMPMQGPTPYWKVRTI